MAQLEINPWEVGLGETNGHLIPSTQSALDPDGNRYEVLGAELAGQWSSLRDGDYAEILQDADFTDLSLVRVDLGVVARTPLPIGASWRCQLSLGSELIAEFQIDDSRSWGDIVVSTVAYTTGAPLAARLLFDDPSAALTGCVVELPAVLIDIAAWTDGEAALVLGNRNPEPNHTDIATSSNISVDVIPTIDADDVNSILVYVDGVLAFQDGVFQSGFGGVESNESLLINNHLRIVVDPETDIAANESHTIRVVAGTVGGATVDESYSFTTVDTLPPTITLAEMIDLSTIRVTFNEALDTTTALLAASYSLALETTSPRLPAVRGQDIIVSGVSKVTDTVYDLTLDMEPTPRALYTLTASVEDENGNAGTLAFLFYGFEPVVDERRVYDYLALIPDIAFTKDDTGFLRNLLLAMQEVGELLLYECDAWPDILDPDTAPEKFLDAMLWDLGYPFDFVLTINEKRKIVQLLRAMYKQKGTDVGIINAIRLFMGIEVMITVPTQIGVYLGINSFIGTELVLGSSELADIYTFHVNVDFVLTDEETTRMNQIIDYMKRAPCHWRIIAPSEPVVIDHMALGLSRLGVNTVLHE